MFDYSYDFENRPKQHNATNILVKNKKDPGVAPKTFKESEPVVKENGQHYTADMNAPKWNNQAHRKNDQDQKEQ